MDESNEVELSFLFKEKSLFAVYKIAPPFTSSSFNKWVTIAFLFCLSALSVLHVVDPKLREIFVFQFSETFTLWANVGAALAGTILGFLIAGFAILCTILRTQTMIALNLIWNNSYKMSELKLLFVSFVEVMIQYLALLFWSILVLIVGGKAGPAAMLGRLLGEVHWMIPFVALHLIFVCWGTWLVAMVLILKSFVYNLYQSLLLGLADAAVDYQKSETQEKDTMSSVVKEL